MTDFSKTGIIIASLLIIPGLVLQVHAQYDIPDIPDFDIGDIEIPSQEDIAKMMEQNEVSGKYVNSDHGVEVTIPEGWSGMESNFKEPSTDEWISGFQVMEGGLNANMAAMQEGKFAIIMLSIIDIPEDKTPPEPQPPSDEFDAKCDDITVEKIKMNNKDVMKMEAECKGTDVSMKTRAYHYLTSEKIVMFGYTTSPASDFDNDLNKFEESVKTLTVANQVDVDYIIPDYMKAAETTPAESSTDVPGWVKQVAEFWIVDQIDDAGFVQVIEYLVQQGIIYIPNAEAPEGEAEVEIPGWIKLNAEFWIRGDISDKDFAVGIEWLINNGIIRV